MDWRVVVGGGGEVLSPGEIVMMARGIDYVIDLYASLNESGCVGIDLAGQLGRNDVALVTDVMRTGSGLFGVYMVRLVGPRGGGWIWGDLLRRVDVK